MILVPRTVMPRSLFGRSLLIVLLPLLILQGVLAYIFYERHWETVTRWLSIGVAGEIATVVDLLEQTGNPEARKLVLDTVGHNTGMFLTFKPGVLMTDPGTREGFRAARVDAVLREAFDEKLQNAFAVFNNPTDPDTFIVHVQLPEGLLSVVASRKRITTTTATLLVLWMVGASTVLLAIAVFFLRRQIRPIRRLAEAAESFGKGRDVGDFRLEGALEIRQAGRAFNLMRHRILRFMTQRTDMLAAVSHDLRTPLTRMKLELEMLDPSADPAISGLLGDVDDMERLVEAYLAFARGEGRESMEMVELSPLLEEMRERAERTGAKVEMHVEDELDLTLRPIAFKRCLGNLIDNACRYGQRLDISAKQVDGWAEIMVEDDGPGIPEDSREEVFQAFVRLEPSRNPGTGGVGLGLTIARDVVLSHGGELNLERSLLGGLKAVVRLPI